MDIKTLLKINQQRINNNRRAYAEYLRNEALTDELAAEEAARQRQRSEEIKKRAVEELAKQDQQNSAIQNSSKKQKAGAEEETPRLQPSSFVPDSNVVVNAQDDIKRHQNVDNVPFYKIPLTNPQDKYYPKSWLDNPGRLTYDPQTMKPMWGQTVREQQERKRLIEDTPFHERSGNEFDYYDQLTRQYLNTNSSVEPEDDSITGADIFGTASRIISRNPFGGPLPAVAFADWATGGHLGVANWLDNTMSYFHINKNEDDFKVIFK